MHKLHSTNATSLQTQQNGNGNIIDLKNVVKDYQLAAGTFRALKGIDLQIRQGEFVAVVGKSGSGKSTLLNVLSGIDAPTSGQVIVTDTPVHSLTQNQVAIWRGNNVGVVFQFFQLIPTLTVVENVMLPMDFCNTYPTRERRDRALNLLEQVGIQDQATKLPALLSGGQQQRAAIARALANDPPILMADEPTGNLDSATAVSVLNLFSSLVAKGKTIVMVTHQTDFTSEVTRMISLSDGEVTSDSVNQSQRKKVVNS